MQKKLLSKRTDKIGATRFWNEVMEHINDGWKVVLSGDMRTAPRFFPYPSIVLVKDEAEDTIKEPYRQSPTQPTGESTADKDEGKVVEAPEKPSEPAGDKVDTTVAPTAEVSLESELEALHGKDDLLAFAAKHNIEVPEDKPWPKAIKKHISEALKSDNK